MSKFIAPDLSSLGSLPLVPIDYEATEQARVAQYTAALEARGIEYDVEGLETDPLRIAYSEGGAYVEMLIDARINEAIRALSLATATGASLDHIAATYYGISRLADETDERFRARTALASEAWSTAGPEGAYIFHVLELDGTPDIADVAVWGEEDGATYSDTLHADAYTEGQVATPFTGRGEGDPVLAPEVLIVVLPAVAYGTADAALLSRAYAAATAREVRPIGDLVRIEAAQVVEYAVEVTIRYSYGADPAPLVAEAKARIEAYVAARRRIGVVAERLGIGGAAYVSGVEAVTLASPAADVGGGSKQAPHCTGVTVTAVQADATWQS